MKILHLVGFICVLGDRVTVCQEQRISSCFVHPVMDGNKGGFEYLCGVFKTGSVEGSSGIPIKEKVIQTPYPRVCQR